ncbi:hypothetical protein MKQ68_06180 [Chitinophaga horti]|uniref:Uncharacterized protein n=1 Tax=Chitinophaga horti TaxID=2920382 RepID=A0ABY6J8R3_9BACT|nr:hypothetical protein [Chitinophaga horti]UYQ94676.1 hypothetical protein MKQ68_06180 [Chitinophaga horti]
MKMLPRLLCACICILFCGGTASAFKFTRTADLQVTGSSSFTIGSVVTYTTIYGNFTDAETVAYIGGTLSVSYSVTAVVVNYGSYGGFSSLYFTNISHTYSGSTYPVYSNSSPTNSYLAQYHFLMQNAGCTIRNSANNMTLADVTYEIWVGMTGSIINPGLTSTYTITGVTNVP